MKIPKSWRRMFVIKLAKKLNLKECKSSRGGALLSVVGKILGRIIRSRINFWLKKEQAGYRKGRAGPHPAEYHQTGW